MHYNTSPEHHSNDQVREYFRHLHDKKTCIELIRTFIGATTVYAKKLVENVQEMMLRLTDIDICCCLQCGKGKLVYLRPIVSSAYDDTS